MEEGQETNQGEARGWEIVGSSDQESRVKCAEQLRAEPACSSPCDALHFVYLVAILRVEKQVLMEHLVIGLNI